MEVKNKKGFTLIELVIAVGILALLLTVLVPNILGFVGQSDAVAAEANAKTAYSAAMQVSLIGGETSGRLATGRSDTTDSNSDANQIQRVLGSGTVIIGTGAPSSSSVLSDAGENAVYIQLDTAGIPVAAYYEKLESRYPKEPTATTPN